MSTQSAHRKTLLITGACGFLGTTISRALSSHYRIIPIDNGYKGSLLDYRAHTGLTPLYLDIVSPDFLKECGDVPIDTIIHLASIVGPERCYDDPVLTERVTEEGTRNVIALARRHNARVVFTSSSEVYGESLRMNEASELPDLPQNTRRSSYYRSKMHAEKLLCDSGLPVTILRVFNTYGPYMNIRDGRVIPTVIRQALFHEPITIHGDGIQTRSFMYADDFVYYIRALLSHEKPLRRFYNIGNPEETRIGDLVSLILKSTESRSTVVYAENDAYREYNPVARLPDTRALIEDFGALPDGYTSLEEGIKQTVNYYKGILETESRVPTLL